MLPPSEREPTNNELIEAYLLGKEKGMEEDKQLKLSQLKSNMKDAAILTGKVFSLLKKSGLRPVSAHLRVQSWNSLNVLVLVEEKDMLSEGLLKSYNEMAVLEQEANNTLRYIDLSVTDGGDHLDRESLVADGFMFTYRNHG